MGPTILAPERLALIFTSDYRWLVERLRYRFNCREHAEDIASDSFLKLSVMPALEKIEKPRAMLTTISKHIIYEKTRRDALERAYIEALAAAPEHFEPSPEKKYLIMESLVALDKALGKISEKARSAFFKSQLDGMTYSQIATELGVSASMVRQYMAKALTQCYIAASETHLYEF